MWSFLKIHHEAIIALLALLVSCVAIFQTTASLRMQREHNYRSVRPMASVYGQNFENRIGVLLENRGLGPMLIVKLVVKRGNKDLGTNLVDVMPLLSNRHWSNYWRDIEGAVLQPGKTIELILLTGEPSDQTYIENRDTIRKELSALTIELTYSDIYGNPFHESEQLSYFGGR